MLTLTWMDYAEELKNTLDDLYSNEVITNVCGLASGYEIWKKNVHSNSTVNKLHDYLTDNEGYLEMVDFLLRKLELPVDEKYFNENDGPIAIILSILHYHSHTYYFEKGCHFELAYMVMKNLRKGCWAYRVAGDILFEDIKNSKIAKRLDAGDRFDCMSYDPYAHCYVAKEYRAISF